VTWRCSYERALEPVEAELSNKARYRIAKGGMEALCAHEAGHAVMMMMTGEPLEQIEVGLTFQWYYGGKTLALPHGRAKRKGVVERDAVDVGPLGLPLSRVTLQYCWRAFIKIAIVAAAGPAAEWKFRAQTGLPREHVCRSDSRALEWYKRFVWLTSGRDGDAFTRLAWREACRLMDVPLIWKAVQAVKTELFSGLLRLEPGDPQAGDRIEFVMPISRIEQLTAGAGQLPNLTDVHRCGPECRRGSRTSRRWQRYLAEWAKEEKPADAA
jgi:hypothetical protein